MTKKKPDQEEYSAEELQAKYLEAVKSGETSATYDVWVASFIAGASIQKSAKKAKTEKKKKAAKPKKKDAKPAKGETAKKKPAAKKKSSGKKADVSKLDDRKVLDSGLTEKKEHFCRQYIALKFNGTQAAIAAGYSKRSAPQTASRLLSNDKVQAFIAKLAEPVNKELDISAQRVLREVGMMAFATLGDFIKEDPVTGSRYLSIDDVDIEKLRGLNSLEITQLPPVAIGTGPDGEEMEREVLKTKMTLAKTKGLELLMRHHKLLGTEDITINIGQMDKVIAALEATVERIKQEEEGNGE